MNKSDKRSKQLGSVLLVAIISLLTVGTVATGLNVLIVQDVDTSVHNIEAMQATSVKDSTDVFVKEEEKKCKADCNGDACKENCKMEAKEKRETIKSDIESELYST